MTCLAAKAADELLARVKVCPPLEVKEPVPNFVEYTVVPLMICNQGVVRWVGSA